MHETIRNMAQEFVKQREKRRRACAAFTALAILVSISTTYLLVQPASTMAADTAPYICGMKEHVHSDECYSAVPLCGYEDAEDTMGAAPEQPDLTDDPAEETDVPLAGEAPEAEDPTAEEPVVEEPAVEDPAVEDPAVEEPVAEEPVTEEPAVEEPAVEEPVAEEPVVEEPVVEEPVVEEPVTEEPVVEESAAEAPAQEISSEPAAEQPAQESFGNESFSGRSIEKKLIAYTNGPEESSEEPAVEEPATEEPAAGEPVVEEPAAEEPAAEEPAAEEPAAEEPVVEEPVVEEPVVEEPVVEEPVVEEPVVEEPVVEEPVAEEPVTEEPEVEEEHSHKHETAHVHTDECYLKCGKEEHIHDEACFPEDMMAFLPEGVEIPEGYYPMPPACGEGYSVTVYAPMDALPEDAVLEAILLTEGDAYENAEQTLKAIAAKEIEVTVGGVMSEDALAEAAASVEATVSDETSAEEPVVEAAQEETPVPEVDAEAEAEEPPAEEPVTNEPGVEESEEVQETEPEEQSLEASLLHMTSGPEDAASEEEPVAEPEDETVEEPEVEEPTAEEPAAEEPIPYEEEFSYDGFVALDIHFLQNGEEIKPTKPVFVAINVNGLLPDDVEPASVAIQHHVEGKEEKSTLQEKVEDLIPALASEPVVESVEMVADSNDNTGVVSADGEDAASLFAVNDFSVFTVTWTTAAVHTLTLHYVKADGTQLYAPTNQAIDRLKDEDGKVTLEKIVQNTLPYQYKSDGYNYQSAYVYVENDSSGTKVENISAITYQAEDPEGWMYKTVQENGESEWTAWDAGTTGNADVYLIFEEDAEHKIDTAINPNIEVHLFDYGTGINTTSDAVLNFFGTDSPSGSSSKTNDEFNQIDGDGGGTRDGDAPKLNAVLDADGYPYANTSNSTNVKTSGSLKYLFNKDLTPEKFVYPQPSTFDASTGYSTKFDVKHYTMENDGGLFIKDPVTGYYQYDSGTNAAFFNGTRFQLYDAYIAPGFQSNAAVTDTSSTTTWTNFMPFNDPHAASGIAAKTLKGKPVYFTGYKVDGTGTPHTTNNWFGMTVEFDFYMPKGGKVNGQNMPFEFAGDDDVWVFIDDVLVLDIGGTHGKQEANINFATGTVLDQDNANDSKKATQKTKYLDDIFSAAGKNISDFNGNTFGDYTKHTLKFFYMERGGNIGYCHMKFNMPMLPENSLMVTKNVEVEGSNAEIDVVNDYQFRVWKADKSGAKTTDLAVNAGDRYTILKNGEEMGTGTVGADGIFHLKSGESAVFDKMMQRTDEANGYKYVVEELIPEVTSGIYEGVYYEMQGDTGETAIEGSAGESFTGYLTPALDAKESRSVTYNNKVYTTKVYDFSITKAVQNVGPYDTNSVYTMRVLLTEPGGTKQPIPVGMAYMLGSEAKTVEQEGLINLKAGETATLKVLDGTSYEVTEVAANGAALDPDDFIVSYADTAGDSKTDAIGTVNSASGDATVTVTNMYPVVELSKTIMYSSQERNNGEKFTFELSGVPDGTYNTNAGTVTFADGKATVEITAGESLTIYGISGGTKLQMKELNYGGYAPSWTVTDLDSTTVESAHGDTAVVTVTAQTKAEIAFTNTTGPELPSTGGTGTHIYTILGTVMMLSAGVLLLDQRRRREGTSSAT